MSRRFWDLGGVRMLFNPNTEISLCFVYVLGTTVTIAFVNHVGFVDVFVFQIEKGLNFPCQPNCYEDTIVPSKIGQFVHKCGTCFLISFENSILIVIRLLSSNRLVGIIGSSSCKRSWKDLIVLSTKYIGIFLWFPAQGCLIFVSLGARPPLLHFFSIWLVSSSSSVWGSFQVFVHWSLKFPIFVLKLRI